MQLVTRGQTSIVGSRGRGSGAGGGCGRLRNSGSLSSICTLLSPPFLQHIAWPPGGPLPPHPVWPRPTSPSEYRGCTRACPLVLRPSPHPTLLHAGAPHRHHHHRRRPSPTTFCSALCLRSTGPIPPHVVLISAQKRQCRNNTHENTTNYVRARAGFSGGKPQMRGFHLIILLRASAL